MACFMLQSLVYLIRLKQPAFILPRRDDRQHQKERKKKSLWNIRKTLKPSIKDRIDTSTNILAYRALSKRSSLAKCFADHEASIVKTRTVLCQPSCDIFLVVEIQEMGNLAVFGSHDWDI